MDTLLTPVRRLTLAALLVLSIILAGSTTVGQAVSPAAVPSTVLAQVFDVNCTSPSIPITTTYTKLQDLAVFSVQAPDSTVEATFNGRIRVASFVGSTGAIFELRVDNVPTTHSRARANMKDTEAGNNGVQSSITGIFTGLSAGNHTASMWVRSTYGTGTGAMLDPGCYGTDALIIKEYLPIGYTFMPSVQAP